MRRYAAQNDNLLLKRPGYLGDCKMKLKKSCTSALAREATVLYAGLGHLE